MGSFFDIANVKSAVIDFSLLSPRLWLYLNEFLMTLLWHTDFTLPRRLYLGNSPEMESSFLTLMDLDKELNWIKTTNKPYITIETMVNEIVNRKNVIFESVKDLIVL